MQKVSGIYKITSPSGRIYIGQSVHVHDRLRKYRRLGCKRQTLLYNSFVKHGVDNHEFVVIEECPSDKLDERESFYISFFNCFNTELGMNLTSGGGRAGTVSDETRLKISVGHKGKIISEESRRKMSVAQKNRSAEISALITKRNKGNKHGVGHKPTPENLQKFIAAGRIARAGKSSPLIGRKHKPETIQKMAIAHTGKRKVIKNQTSLEY